MFTHLLIMSRQTLEWTSYTDAIARVAAGVVAVDQ